MSDQDPTSDPVATGQAADIAPIADLSRTRPLDVGQALEQRLLGTRLSGLALDMVDLLDRSLFERTNDVRRWAAEPAVLDCLSGPALTQDAARRLHRIIADRTLYLDLWVVDASGRIVATGRPDRFPGLIGGDVSTQIWFRDAIASRPGSATLSAIAVDPRLGGAVSLPFAAAIRGPDPAAPACGAIALFFDWRTQSDRLLHHARQRGGGAGLRCLLLDATHRTIADTDTSGGIANPFPFAPVPTACGWYRDAHDIVVGYARCPGHQGFAGPGWYGIVARRATRSGHIH